MSKTKTGVTVASAAALAIACANIKPWEGYWATAKVDTVGTGQPCTGGYGETEDVKCGETHDEKYWADRLAKRLPEYDAKIGACIRVEVPDNVRAAMISAAYNAGPAAVCRSSMVAKINAKDFRGACMALLTKDAQGNYSGWYIRARGKVVKGLIHRRAKEQNLCLSGLDKPVAKPAQAPVANPWWKRWFGWMFK